MLTKAIFFATKAHEGQMRKMTNTPYILHPIEVASIISTITDDQDIMAAGVLHDVIEDCHIDPATIRELFGPRVSAWCRAIPRTAWIPDLLLRPGWRGRQIPC